MKDKFKNKSRYALVLLFRPHFHTIKLSTGKLLIEQAISFITTYIIVYTLYSNNIHVILYIQ